MTCETSWVLPQFETDIEPSSPLAMSRVLNLVVAVTLFGSACFGNQQ